MAENNSKILVFYWPIQKPIRSTGEKAVAALEEFFFHSDFGRCFYGDSATMTKICQGSHNHWGLIITLADNDSSLIKMSDVRIGQRASLHECRSKAKFEEWESFFFSFKMQFFHIVWGGKA